jgi:DNA-binding MarR family transcriptional regulator
MKSYLEKYFGLDVKELAMDVPYGLPVYMTTIRTFKKYEIDNYTFIIVIIHDNDKYGVPALKRQLQIYREVMKCEIVFSFEEISQVQRNALVKAKLPFISVPYQIYMPFIGILFVNKFNKKNVIKVDKMMPATQQTFLYLLYYNKDQSIMKSALAKAVGLTRTSITRATDQLMQMQLITQEKKGKEIYIHCVEQGRGLYELAKPFLINPIHKELVIKKSEILLPLLKAGETALAEQTMLNPPALPEYAILKGNINLVDIIVSEPLWEENSNLKKIQIWKYDPNLFTKNEYVDPISLLCSFKENVDERIEQQLDMLLEEIKW